MAAKAGLKDRLAFIADAEDGGADNVRNRRCRQHCGNSPLSPTHNAVKYYHLRTGCNLGPRGP